MLSLITDGMLCPGQFDVTPPCPPTDGEGITDPAPSAPCAAEAAPTDPPPSPPQGGQGGTTTP